MIFSYLDPTQKIKLSRVCKRWHEISRTKLYYNKGQLEGRTLVLIELLKKHKDHNAEAILQEAKIFLQNLNSDYSSLKIPHIKGQNILGKIIITARDALHHKEASEYFMPTITIGH